MFNNELDLYNIKIDDSKKYFKYKKEVGIAFIALGVIVSSAFVFKSYEPKFSNNNIEKKQVAGDNLENNSNNIKEIPKNTNKYLAGYIDENIVDDKFKYYIDKDYEFHCAIPANFLVGNSIGGGNRLMLMSPSSDAFMFIGASNNDFDLSAEEVLNQYIAESTGEIILKDIGENWYEVKKIVDGKYYYRKCFVDETIRWFEFNVKEDSEFPLEENIDYINENFDINYKLDENENIDAETFK